MAGTENDGDENAFGIWLEGERRTTCYLGDEGLKVWVDLMEHHICKGHMERRWRVNDLHDCKTLYL